MSLPSRSVCLNFIFLPDFKACGKIGGGLFLAAASAYNFRKVFHSCFLLFFFFGDVALKQLLPLFFVVFLVFFFLFDVHCTSSNWWRDINCERTGRSKVESRSEPTCAAFCFF